MDIILSGRVLSLGMTWLVSFLVVYILPSKQVLEGSEWHCLKT